MPFAIEPASARLSFLPLDRQAAAARGHVTALEPTPSEAKMKGPRGVPWAKRGGL